MKHSCRWTFAIILLTFGLALNITDAQEPLGTVAQPVSGLYARYINTLPNTQLGVFNALNNAWENLLPAIDERAFWSADGHQIVLRPFSEIGAILSYPNLTVAPISQLNGITFELPPQQMTFRPIGWSSNNDNLVYYASYDAIDDLPRQHRLYLIDPAGNVLESIREWSVDQIVTDLPLPLNATTVSLTGESLIERNPVYDDWLALLLTGSGFYSNLQMDEPVAANVNILWNFQTQQAISLDNLVTDLYIMPSRTDWSQDGEYLLLNAVDKNLINYYILKFHFRPEIGAILAERAIVKNRIAEHMLDAGDIFFSQVSDIQNGASYMLGEIVNGEYRETPFFTLNGEMFDSKSRGDWFMQAEEAERNRLSCLFDRALPTQLAVDDEAQVVADDGVGLRLRAAPDRFSAELQTMAEATTMTVINGPACSGGYRWWQVEMTDGTVGWAAEADASEYFLQSP